MLLDIKKIKIPRLAQVSGTIGISNVVSIVGQIAKTKVLSVAVGPAGLGLISQASQLQSTLSNIGSLPLGGLQNALNRRSESNSPEFFLIADLGLRLLLWTVGIVLVIVAFAASPIARAIFSVAGDASWVYAVALSFPFYTVGALSDSILVAAKRIRLFTQCRITIYVLLPAGTVVGVLVGGIGGAIWGGSLGYSLGVAIQTARCFYAIGIPRFCRQSLLWDASQWSGEKPIFAEVVLLSLATAAVGFVSLIIPLVLRTRVLTLRGADHLGLYQATFSLVAALSPFVFNGVWGHFYPAISVEKEPAKLSHATDECVRFCVLGLFPAYILVLLGGKLIIPLGYSSRFLSILPWLSVQMSAETVWQAFGVVLFLLLGMNQLRLYAAMVTVQYGSFFAMGWWACNHYGAAGIIGAQLVSGFCTLVFGVYLMHHFLGLKLTRVTLALIPALVFCLLLIGWWVNR